ncbi:unnamed protein product [Prorocentrum cordatum]|uniref:Uncharacterized protein n=1 Tax=Prorocentrum cordatum TaxID=2364126 RepID=A0ABN9TT81_9DINO|nr:unnamed protein product [Polarella glacialis]
MPELANLSDDVIKRAVYWFCKAVSINYALMEVLLLIKEKVGAMCTIETRDDEGGLVTYSADVSGEPPSQVMRVRMAWRSGNNIVYRDPLSSEKKVKGTISCLETEFGLPPPQKFAPAYRLQMKLRKSLAQRFAKKVLLLASSGTEVGCGHLRTLSDEQTTMILQATHALVQVGPASAGTARASDPAWSLAGDALEQLVGGGSSSSCAPPGAGEGASAVHQVSSWCSHVVTFLLGVLIGPFVLPAPLSCKWLVGGLFRGDVHVIRYRVGGPQVFHERITLFDAPPLQAVIVTVDGDVYLETVVVNADCEEVMPLRGLGAPVYGVAEALGRAVWGHLRDGALLLGSALPPSPFTLAGGAGAGGAWVPQLDFATAARDSTTTPRDDWPTQGPRTTQWCLDHMRRNAGGPLAWPSKWKAEARPRDSDSLNTAELAAFELARRHSQLIEERHYEDTLSAQVAAEEKKDEKEGFGVSESLLASEAEHYMGVAASKGNLCISRALAEFIAEQLKAGVAVAKERRKAREERAARA